MARLTVESIRSDFLTNRGEMLSVESEKWGDVLFYARPSVSEMMEITKAQMEGGNNAFLEAVFFTCARTETGGRLFDPLVVAKLREEMDPHELVRVATEMTIKMDFKGNDANLEVNKIKKP